MKIYKTSTNFLISRKIKNNGFEFLIFVPEVYQWGLLGFGDKEQDIKYFHGGQIQIYYGELPILPPIGTPKEVLYLKNPELEKEMYE